MKKIVTLMSSVILASAPIVQVGNAISNNVVAQDNNQTTNKQNNLYVSNIDMTYNGANKNSGTIDFKTNQVINLHYKFSHWGEGNIDLVSLGTSSESGVDISVTNGQGGEGDVSIKVTNEYKGNQFCITFSAVGANGDGSPQTITFMRSNDDPHTPSTGDGDNVINGEVKFGTVTTKYVDLEGKTIHDSVSTVGKVGDKFQTTPADIEGYVFKRIKEGENADKGQYKSGNQTVTYVYAKTIPWTNIENPIINGEVKFGTVTTKYVDLEGETIHDSVSTVGKVGDKFQTTPADIEGYVFKRIKEGENADKGQYKSGNQTVTYVYAKTIPWTDIENPIINGEVKFGTVTTKYVDLEGKTIHDSVSKVGKVGDAFQTTPANIEGYVFKRIKEGENADKGQYKSGNQTVTYVYADTLDWTEILPENGTVTAKYFIELDGRKTALFDDVENGRTGEKAAFALNPISMLSDDEDNETGVEVASNVEYELDKDNNKIYVPFKNATDKVINVTLSKDAPMKPEVPEVVDPDTDPKDPEIEVPEVVDPDTDPKDPEVEVPEVVDPDTDPKDPEIEVPEVVDPDTDPKDPEIEVPEVVDPDTDPKDPEIEVPEVVDPDTDPKDPEVEVPEVVDPDTDPKDPEVEVPEVVDPDTDPSNQNEVIKDGTDEVSEDVDSDILNESITKVVKETDEVVKDGTDEVLPQTNEVNSPWIISLGLILLVTSALGIISIKRSTNK